jgi:outer membrane murein-binding lipoprotein Lpp
MTTTDQASGMDAPSAPPQGEESTRDVVRSLMEERRRFESWLSALDARRDATPPRVFARVHADYAARLEAVVGQLTSHSDGLESELGRLSERLEAAHDQQQQARDERAEAELRAHVGELSPAEWEETARAADERIDMLVSRHADLESELLRTRELLTAAQRPTTPPTASTGISGDPKARDVGVEASVSASVSAAAANATPAAMTAVSDRAEGSLPVPSGRDEVGRPGANDLPVQETSAAVIAAEAELLEGPPPGQAPRARPSASTFDEMAFLNSVVDTPAKATDRAEPPRESAVGGCDRESGCDRGHVDPGIGLEAWHPAWREHQRQQPDRAARQAGGEREDAQVLRLRCDELSHGMVLRAVRSGAGVALRRRQTKNAAR